MDISFHQSCSGRSILPRESFKKAEPLGGLTTLPTILALPPRFPATGMNACSFNNSRSAILPLDYS